MKKIITWIIIFILGTFIIHFWISLQKNIFVVEKYSYIHWKNDPINKVIINSKYIDHFQEKLRKTHNNPWIEIQDYFVENKKIRFAHIFYWKTFICRNWKLIIQYNWEEKEIFSYDNENTIMEPCTFNVEQTQNDHIFLVDFCLLGWWWSWECFWIDMYYDVSSNNWREGKLFHTWYKIYDMVKLPVNKNDANWEFYEQIYNEFIKSMKLPEFTYCNFQ